MSELTSNAAIRRALEAAFQSEKDLARAQILAAEFPENADMPLHLAKVQAELIRHYRLSTYLLLAYWERNKQAERGRHPKRDPKTVAEVWRRKDLCPLDSGAAIARAMQAAGFGIEPITARRILKEPRP